GYDARKSV
ncbi:DNA polymerase III, alpha subunit, partial [Vibrio parahaemolyticus SBR10290]